MTPHHILPVEDTVGRLGAPWLVVDARVVALIHTVNNVERDAVIDGALRKWGVGK